jgi:hypothetical protein
MKKFLLIPILFAATSCGSNANDVSIEEIKANKEVEIEKEETKQMQVQLKIEQEKSKQLKNKK